MTFRKLPTAVLLALCAQSAFAQTSLWTNSPTPAVAAANDGSAVTVGLKFSSTVAGTVRGVRYYKSSTNTGTHVGTLWSASGAKLAEVVFSGETSSGWQQASFSSPVSINANTTYVISVLAPYGRYAANEYFSWSPLTTTTPLRVVGTAPGVYTYGTGVRFPTQSWHNTNYWVDVVFAAQGSSATYTISGAVTGSSATLTLSGGSGAKTSTGSNGTFQFTGLPAGTYVVAPSQSGFTFSPSTRTVNVTNANVTGVNFTASPATSVSRSVTLTWVASTSTGLVGYNVYRGTSAQGPFSKITSSPVNSTTFVDSNVTAGATYYYVATAVDANSESAYSAQASATLPR